MNEVTKLYANAGVSCKPNYIYNKVPILIGLDYPPFTAEKQLELIKLIANRKGYPDYEYFGNLFDDYIQLLEFDEALAKLVNLIWESLTEEEHKQIKNILESEVRE